MAEFHKIPVDLFNNIFDYIGTGDPTSTLPNAATGSLYRKLDGVSGSTLWQKTSTVWEALQGSAWNPDDSRWSLRPTGRQHYEQCCPSHLSNLDY
jgi:hypothetical protein